MVMERIAQGGMGAVYKAQDRRLNNKVIALKEMATSAVPPHEWGMVLSAFRQEAELLARLNHPNLVRVTDFFKEGERHYIVMEFLEGHTLQDLLEEAQEPFPEERVLKWADQLCDVLSYLHNQPRKIIYRDLKPANVMILADDTVKLIDFGIARFYKPGKKKDTIEFGTDGYAPPEQYGRSQTDEQADIYALGATLHQLLTLRNPLERPFYFPPIRKLNPQVSPHVEAAIAQALEPDKEKRLRSAEELRSALQGETKAAPQTPQTKKKKAKKRAAAARRKPPSMIISPDAEVNLGWVMLGTEESVSVSIPAGQEATYRTTAPWLQVTPEHAQAGERVTLTVIPEALRPGRWHGNTLLRLLIWPAGLLVPAEQVLDTEVIVEPENGDPHSIAAHITVAPPPQQVLMRWIMAIGVWLLTAGVAIIGLILALAGTLWLSQ